jgi:hypothetical protein
MAASCCPGCTLISRRSGGCKPSRRVGARHAAFPALDSLGCCAGPALSVAVHLVAGSLDRAGPGSDGPASGDAGSLGLRGLGVAPASAPSGGTDPGGLMSRWSGQQHGDPDRPRRSGPLGGDDHGEHSGGGAAHTTDHWPAGRPLRAGGRLEAAVRRAAGGSAAGGAGCCSEARRTAPVPAPGTRDAAPGDAGRSRPASWAASARCCWSRVSCCCLAALLLFGLALFAGSARISLPGDRALPATGGS